MHWLLGESTDWRACDDMAFAHSRDAWRSLPCSIACLPARQMVPEEGYIAGYYGTLDGPCLPCKMGSAAVDSLHRGSRGARSAAWLTRRVVPAPGSPLAAWCPHCSLTHSTAGHVMPRASCVALWRQTNVTASLGEPR